MSRLFSVSFESNKNKHEAIVHITQQEGEPHYDVRFQEDRKANNNSLGRLSWKGERGYKDLEQYKQGESREVLDQLVAQIDTHLTRINFK